MNISQNYSSLTGLSAGVQYSITVRTVGALGYLSSPQNLTAYTSKQCTFVVIHVYTYHTSLNEYILYTFELFLAINLISTIQYFDIVLIYI